MQNSVSTPATGLPAHSVPQELSSLCISGPMQAASGVDSQHAHMLAAQNGALQVSTLVDPFSLLHALESIRASFWSRPANCITRCPRPSLF
eukprot:1050319-Pelagomonas_calceolata.AAC.3